MDDEYDGKRLMIIAGVVHSRPEPRSRADWLALARSRGTHTPTEWRAVRRAANGQCRYCAVELNVFNGVRDHKVPVARGGSDAVDNLDYICWQCNAEKAMRTPQEWSYEGPCPRPFRPLPAKRREWDRLTEGRRR